MKNYMRVKRLFSFMLVIALLITTMPTGMLTVNAVTTQFAGGSGTAADPYLIETKEHLNNVRNDLDAHYKMIADIEFTDADFTESGDFYNEGKGWSPIGFTESNAFRGYIDGCGYKISGIKIIVNITDMWSSGQQYYGLFGYSYGTIKNINLKNISVSVYDHGHNVYVGTLCGYNRGTLESIICEGTVCGSSSGNTVRAGGITGENLGNIDNVSFSGSVSSNSVNSSAYAGGIAGTSSNATIQRSSNFAKILANCSNYDGMDYAGGMSGKAGQTLYCQNSGEISAYYAGGISGYGGVISESYNKGTIKDSTYAGGIAGYSSNITNCFNIGNISATKYAGGIIGQLTGGELSNSYNLGEINDATYKGNIAGGNHGTVYAEDLIANGGTITSCYFPSSSLKGVGRVANIDGTVADIAGASTLNNLKKQTTYSNWNFTNVWNISENNVYYYPELRNCPLDLGVTSISMDVHPTKRSYLEGKDSLSTTGGLINVIYDNGFSDKVSFTKNMVTGFDNTKLGSQTLTVNFGGKTTNYTVTITAKKLSSISMSSLPTKVVYLEGKDSLTLAGGQLTLTYNNGTTEVIDITPDMVTGFDNKVVGVQNLTVSYGGKTTTFTVEVIKKTLSSISINTMPTQTSYVEGAGRLNLDGATLLLSYDNDDTDIITINSNMVSGFNSATIGKKTIAVVYSGMECTFDIEIVSNGIDFISVTTLPNKLSYFESKDSFSVAGGKLTVYYNDGSHEEIDLTQGVVSGFNIHNVGKQTLTVTYNRRTCTFEIEVIAYKFKSGSGTESNPYLISTKGQLDNVRNYLGSHFKLANDIEFSNTDFAPGGMFYNNGAGWIPIKSTFTGVLDGNGHSIYNLQINANSSSSTTGVGLFAQNNGTIKNLGMENGKIVLALSADVYGKAGAIAGYNKGTISNCFNTCKVEVNGSTGNGAAGGIAGYNTDGTIINCYNTGIIYSSNDSAGGITGTNSGTIENCYNTGFIRAELGDDNYCYGGGICGTNHHIVLTCYNIGHISSARSQGGITALLVDIGNPDAKIENCYYLVDDSQAVGVDDDGATKCKKEHMILKNTYSGFDFNNIWVMPSNSDYLYPELVGNSMNFIKKEQGITISSLPYKTEYYVGLENLDITGAKIAKIYNDGTLEEIAVEPSMVTGYDKSKTGSQTITVTYNDTTLEFEVTTLALVYDFTLTTDESISLEYKANKEFDFVLSDESVAKITNVSTSIIDWGTVNVTSSAKVVPLKPGYVIVRVIDKAGYVLSNSLILIEEGNHQLELLETVKKPNCTETGHEIYKCKFCDYQEERFPDALGHTEVLDNRVEPTCTKTGLTGGKHCSVCEEVLVKQNIIEATGIHIWDKGKTDKNGNIHYECDTCEAAYSKNLLSIKVTSKPTKLAYVEHDDMDFSGMVITAYYDNNTTAVISSNWSASYGMNAGTQTVTVEHCGKVDTFTISVKAKVPSAITSSKHTIYGNNISKISAGTTVSSLISSLNEGSFCKVFKGSAEVSGSTVVGTGMVVKIMDGSTVKASYTIIVTGDTNGDGNITVTDMIAIKAHVLKKSTLSGVYATAADTNGDNGISITDFIQVKAKILGKGIITAR